MPTNDENWHAVLHLNANYCPPMGLLCFLDYIVHAARDSVAWLLTVCFMLIAMTLCFHFEKVTSPKSGPIATNSDELRSFSVDFRVLRQNRSKKKFFRCDRSFFGGKWANLLRGFFFSVWDSFEGFFFRTHHLCTNFGANSLVFKFTRILWFQNDEFSNSLAKFTSAPLLLLSKS